MALGQLSLLKIRTFLAILSLQWFHCMAFKMSNFEILFFECGGARAFEIFRMLLPTACAFSSENTE